jgi:hypothetical protein
VLLAAVTYRLRSFVSTASAAESFRSRWGSVRGAPVCSSQTSPTAAAQVVQGTDNICLGVSSLAFTIASCNVPHRENVQYCSVSALLTGSIVIANSLYRL